MDAEMTDEERLAMIRRLNDRLLLQIEQQQARPAWHQVVSSFAGIIGGAVVMAGAIWAVRYLL
jgi:hypothetical protein